MKTLFTSVLALLLSITVLSQTPESIKYQSVIRDNSGNVLANKAVSLKLSILRGLL